MIMAFLEDNPIRERNQSQMAEVYSTIKNWIDFGRRADYRNAINRNVNPEIILHCIKNILGIIRDKRSIVNTVVGPNVLMLISANIVKNKWIRNDTNRYAIIMPSGLGKTYISKKLNNFFVDVDYYYEPYFTKINELIDVGNWSELNTIQKAIISRIPVSDDRILLCHSPSQLPTYYTILHIYNSMELNLRSKMMINNDIDRRTLKLSIMNRKHIKDTCSNKPQYVEVFSNKQLVRLLQVDILKVYHYYNDHDNHTSDKSKMVLFNSKEEFKLFQMNRRSINNRYINMTLPDYIIKKISNIIPIRIAVTPVLLYDIRKLDPWLEAFVELSNNAESYDSELEFLTTFLSGSRGKEILDILGQWYNGIIQRVVVGEEPYIVYCIMILSL